MSQSNQKLIGAEELIVDVLCGIPKLKLTSDQVCVKEEALSTIRAYLLKYKYNKMEAHTANLNMNLVLDKVNKFLDEVYSTKETIKSLNKQPAILSAFYEGLKSTLPYLYYCVEINGNLNIDQINYSLHENIL